MATFAAPRGTTCYIGRGACKLRERARCNVPHRLCDMRKCAEMKQSCKFLHARAGACQREIFHYSSRIDCQDRLHLFAPMSDSVMILVL